jgi:peptide-methionine (S)-S-oxide reductase
MAYASRAQFILATVLGSAAIAAVALLGVHPAGAADSFAVPAPAVDEPASDAGPETAVFAGGCFWGVQGVFQHVSGVTQAESGYAGGDEATAHYETVGTGSTGHAESVRITYDPTKVTYGRLLQIYFSVVTDPTQLDRQGPDVGSQYRSAIFAQNADQERIAAAYIAQLSQANVFPASIVNRVEPNTGFFPAEAYHQNYLDLHPTSAYIVMNDKPKVDDLARLFPQRYRDQPVLVSVT